MYLFSSFAAAIGKLCRSYFSGFFETESKLKDSFLKVADTERDRFRFAYTSESEIIKHTGYAELV